jgi:hypothetical protein
MPADLLTALLTQEAQWTPVNRDEALDGSAAQAGEQVHSDELQPPATAVCRKYLRALSRLTALVRQGTALAEP